MDIVTGVGASERVAIYTLPDHQKAARYILSQRNKQGLIWRTATGTSDWGIIGWRNVIKNYRLLGATTEVNAERYAALRTMAQMARVLGEHEVSAEFAEHAGTLKGFRWVLLT